MFCKRHDGEPPRLVRVSILDSLPRLRVVFPLQLKFPAVDWTARLGMLCAMHLFEGAISGCEAG